MPLKLQFEREFASDISKTEFHIALQLHNATPAFQQIIKTALDIIPTTQGSSVHTKTAAGCITNDDDSLKEKFCCG